MASTIQVDKIQDTGGNTILQSNGSGTATTTLPVGFGGTGAATLAAAGLSNVPAFFVYLSESTGATGSVANNTYTQITGYDTELFDTNSAVSSGTFTVPAGEGGKYLIQAGIFWAGGADAGTYGIRVYINDDSTPLASNTPAQMSYLISGSTANIQNTGERIFTLAAADTVKIYGLQNGGGTKNYEPSGTYFGGYKLIGA